MNKFLDVFSRTFTGIGSIPQGAISFGVLNSGAADGIFNGAPLKAGASINLQAPQYDGACWVFPNLEFDATGTTFVITATYYQE